MRARIKRRTVATEREGGRVYVLLDTAQDADQDAPHTDRTNELMAELRRTNDLLREVINTRDEEIRRRDVIISQLTERIPAIEAPPEAREATETVEAEQDSIGTERARRERAETTLQEGMDEEARRREESERERDRLRRELFALRQQRESPETVEQEPERGEPRSAAGGAQEGARRPWWRRVFGG